MKKLIVIYPGRFQPYGRHHAKAYDYLHQIFPQAEEIIITTSDKTNNTDSPFNYAEKVKFITNLTPHAKISKETNVYIAHNALRFEELNEIHLIVAVSYKDLGRLHYTKADGSPSYFQPYTGTIEHTADKHAYVVILPQFRIDFKSRPISGTLMRTEISKLPKDPNNPVVYQTFKKLFGWFDKSFYSQIKKKL